MYKFNFDLVLIYENFSEAGEIRIYDLRKNAPLSYIQTSQGMTAMTVHQYEDVLAWLDNDLHVTLVL